MILLAVLVTRKAVSAIVIIKVPKQVVVEMAAKAKGPKTITVATRALHPVKIVQSPAVIRRGVHISLRFLQTEVGYHEETR